MSFFTRKPKLPEMSPLQRRAVQHARQLQRSNRDAEERMLQAALDQRPDLRFVPTEATPRWLRVWFWVRRKLRRHG